jgi:5-methylcytosine-specific restriction endonuclease McrA
MKINREIVYQKFCGKCAYCGHKLKFEEMHVDHIIPKSTFAFHMETRHKVPIFLSHLTILDVNHVDNLFPSCQVCNLKKLNYSLEDFRQEVGELINILETKSQTYKLAKRYNFVKTKKVKPIKFYFENE